MHMPNLSTDLNTSMSLEAQLWESDSRFRAFFNQTTLAVILHDSQGRIIDVNDEADHLYRFDRPSMLQMRLSDLDPALAADGFSTYWGNGKPDRITNLSRTHHRRDGSQIPVTISVGPVSYYGKTLGFMYIQDYSHQAKVEAKLRTQARELTLANRYKDEFLESISHELRTPLNGILMLSAHLANSSGNLNPQELTSIKTINKCGRTLCNLINDILDLSKLKSGDIKLRIEPYSVDVLEHSITKEFEVALADSNVSYAIDIDPDVPSVIHTDFFRLWQILQNIISNAVKFTHNGSICVRVSCRTLQSTPAGHDADGSQPMIAITVSDTGIGIDPVKHSQIFHAFKQADRSISRRYGGTGLGLSIASSLCECMGGKIVLESNEGQGSTFTVYIPDQIGMSLVNSQPTERRKIR